MDLCTSGRVGEEEMEKKNQLEVKLVLLAGEVYVRSEGERG